MADLPPDPSKNALAGETQSNFNGIWPKPGAWKNLLGVEGEDFIRKMLAYGPLAIGSRAGGGLGWASSVEHGQPMQNIGGGQMVPVDPGIAGGPSTARANNFLDRVFSTQALRNASTRPAEVVDPYEAALQRQGWQKPANDQR